MGIKWSDFRTNEGVKKAVQSVSSIDTRPQTPEHVLQACPLHAEARLQHWPNWTALADMLWGAKEDTMTTANFINGTGLRV